MRNLLSLLRRQRAFTLIELLVVILIIGILIAIAAPSFLGQQDKAKDSTAKQSLTVAYKAAKSDSIRANGDLGAWASGASLVTAIVDSEPQMAGDLSLTNTPAQGKYGVCADSTASLLKVVAHSGSGNAWLLSADANGQQSIVRGTCAGANDDAVFTAVSDPCKASLFSDECATVSSTQPAGNASQCTNSASNPDARAKCNIIIARNAAGVYLSKNANGSFQGISPVSVEFEANRSLGLDSAYPESFGRDVRLRITGSSGASYTILATSMYVGDGGNLESNSTCATAGQGGCPSSGAWPIPPYAGPLPPTAAELDGIVIPYIADAKAEMEACYDPNGSGYFGCSDSTQRTSVTPFSAESYDIRAYSDSGNEFTLYRDTMGNLARFCNSAGVGKCEPNGTWTP